MNAWYEKKLPEKDRRLGLDLAQWLGRDADFRTPIKTGSKGTRWVVLMKAENKVLRKRPDPLEGLPRNRAGAGATNPKQEFKRPL